MSNSTIDPSKHLKRRSKLELLIDVLFLCDGKNRMTHILYGANISYYQFKKLIKILENIGLVEINTYPRKTEKGNEFIKLFEPQYTPKQLKRYMEGVGL